MTVAIVIAAVLVFSAATLALVRLERGPSMLDRTVALDIFTSALVAVVALEAAWSRRTDTIPLLVAIALVGFIGSVTIARFAAVEPEEEGRVQTLAEVQAEEAARHAREAEEAARVDRDEDAAPEGTAVGDGAPEGTAGDDRHQGGDVR